MYTFEVVLSGHESRGGVKVAMEISRDKCILLKTRKLLKCIDICNENELIRQHRWHVSRIGGGKTNEYEERGTER